MANAENILKRLWSLVVGLEVTGKEFFKPWLTVHYPRQQVENIDTYRGHIELVPRDDDPSTPRCIMCSRCQDICPSRCISLDFHQVEMPNATTGNALMLNPGITSPGSHGSAPAPEQIERKLDRFHLNYSLCSLCGLCVQNCPVGAIRFSKHVYFCATDRSAFLMDLLERMHGGNGDPLPQTHQVAIQANKPDPAASVSCGLNPMKWFRRLSGKPI
ncbi:4Fe-4S binding protein [Desulfatirhabdium butyrativorans]|uniref:4Fe-4S binding protein n=1 Tax=Desulfatirhabdium butyrativorans TaxID=340467 RepID=UPI0004013F4E|nr:4Fe-4S binding protein [Desulfatirhabdium butyrativorans]